MTGESADQPVTRIRCSHRKRKREESEPVEIEVLKDFRRSPGARPSEDHRAAAGIPG
jgi:hypothetical protein